MLDQISGIQIKEEKSDQNGFDNSVEFLRERQNNIAKAKKNVHIRKDLDQRLNIDMKFNATQASFKKVLHFIENKVLLPEDKEQEE